MNWNWPGEISIGVPRMVQLLDGKERFVVASAVKVAPGVLVKVK